MGRQVNHGGNQRKVGFVGGRSTGEVTRFLHLSFFGTDEIGKLFGEPGTHVDFVELHVPKRVAFHFPTAGHNFGNDIGNGSTFRNKDVHGAFAVHHGTQAGSFGSNIDG